MQTPTSPTFLSYALKLSLTLGKKAKPQNNPAMPPPICPKLSDCEFPTPVIRFIIIIRITMNNKIHLVCSSCWPLNAFQLTKIIESKPVKMPKSEVDAPIELSLDQNEENKFPPIL